MHKNNENKRRKIKMNYKLEDKDVQKTSYSSLKF